MTDEEKAEEWVKSQMVPCIQGQVSYFDFAIQAFLAGLKAGKDMVETDLATIAYMQDAEAEIAKE